MEFKPNFEALQPYFQAYWNCEILDKVALSVTAPKQPGWEPAVSWRQPQAVYQQSPDVTLEAFEDWLNHTFFGGLATPCFHPNLGPDVFSGFLGVNLNFSEHSRGTSWANWQGKKFDYADLEQLTLEESNPYYQKILTLTKLALERGKGRYLVGITDLHAGFDSLCVLRGGPQIACLDLVENQEGVKRTMLRLFDIWKKIYDDYYSLISPWQKGTSTWIDIYAPGKMYPVQNDFSCLVSPEMYREFFLPELLAEINYLDYSIYHLDGIEALQHLDILLDIARLNAIQWVPGAKYREESISCWFPLYQKIQEKKKAIVVYPRVEEIPLVLENLKPEGLLISVGCANEDEARTVMKKLGWNDD
ncbi:MAG: hypothetical protein NC911_10475 [Candidatus Omnitrophica bacterium]|nr:hypothetical protein [Candidatus Omnitrophota bacterium]